MESKSGSGKRGQRGQRGEIGGKEFPIENLGNKSNANFMKSSHQKRAVSISHIGATSLGFQNEDGRRVIIY